MGRMLALWSEIDAQFHVVRVHASREMIAGDTVPNPTANARHLRVPGTSHIVYDFSSMRWDDDAADYVLDEKQYPPTYASE